MNPIDPRSLRIADYTYELPDARIARYPLEERDQSKLLVYKEGTILEDQFVHLSQQLPADSLLVINNTRVIRARLLFRKESGSIIEIFCLEPNSRYADLSTAMAQTGEVTWQCLVGGAAKWKNKVPLRLQVGAIVLQAELISKNEDDFSIRFSWNESGLSFAEILQMAGQIPLPPYLGRVPEEPDEQNYQTLFASHSGSVAAPTASLHFTDRVMKSLQDAGIQVCQLTLHVGAGTFMPVKSETAGGHQMHQEWIELSRDLIQKLISHQGPVIASGTTALRTLESIYWLGVKLLETPDLLPSDLVLGQWDAYSSVSSHSNEWVLTALLNWMQINGLERFSTRTGIMIAPGYQFRIVAALLTNFHQPQSTLLLLVAAFIGPDWKRVYSYALSHHFRFLSYGDGSLLWRAH